MTLVHAINVAKKLGTVYINLSHVMIKMPVLKILVTLPLDVSTHPLIAMIMTNVQKIDAIVPLDVFIQK
jgi:hypothetical protein